ncbi:MAG: hypothetical protein GC152_13980 [Alphaproteobacteria bacterium]|nr:hypothetical protein [Alphaproteobacteria bacterium]
MRPGALLIISMVFTLAFVTRAIGTVSDVRDGATAEISGGNASHGSDPLPVRSDDFEPPEHPDGNDADFVSLAGMIKERTNEIQRRIDELNERENLLAAIESRVDEKLQQLAAAQSALAETAARVDAASERDIMALADMYANMKPQQAGAIFNAMEPSFAAGFLTSMRPETAAAILAGMEPQKAYAVSVIIAGRNMNN